MKKVVITGTFDIAHPGHLDFFKQAKEHGSHLIILVSTDESATKAKGSSPRNSQEKRIEQLKALNICDEVIAGQKGDPYKILETIQPDIICLGYDQQQFTEDLEAELKKRNLNTKVIRLKPFKPHKYKTSKLIHTE